MTVEIQNNQSNYLVAQLGKDLSIFQKDTISEASRLKSSIVEKMESPYALIEDEYIPSGKEKSSVSFEERLSQVISTEEMKMLLALVIRSATQTSATKGQNLDTLG